MLNIFKILSFVFLTSGCARLFGWEIHAPGLVSQGFYETVSTADQRVALFVRPELFQYQSLDRGSRFADPQTFYIGEALGPILLEAFEHAFRDFIFMEVKPDEKILQQYAVNYLVFVDLKGFNNAVTLKGQKIELSLYAEVYDSNLGLLAALEVEGTSDAFKVFAKKGGPEVNLNAAIENAVSSLVLFLQDGMRTNHWANDEE